LKHDKSYIMYIIMPVNTAGTATAAETSMDNINANNIGKDTVFLKLCMSCETFWNYETGLHVDRKQFSRKYNNRTEEEAFQTLSRFLCLHMKKHIEDELINEGKNVICLQNWMRSFRNSIFTDKLRTKYCTPMTRQIQTTAAATEKSSFVRIANLLGGCWVLYRLYSLYSLCS